MCAWRTQPTQPTQPSPSQPTLTSEASACTARKNWAVALMRLAGGYLHSVTQRRPGSASFPSHSVGQGERVEQRHVASRATDSHHDSLTHPRASNNTRPSASSAIAPTTSGSRQQACSAMEHSTACSAQRTWVLWLDPNSWHKCRQLVMCGAVQDARECNLERRQAGRSLVAGCHSCKHAPPVGLIKRNSACSVQAAPFCLRPACAVRAASCRTAPVSAQRRRGCMSIRQCGD